MVASPTVPVFDSHSIRTCNPEPETKALARAGVDDGRLFAALCLVRSIVGWGF